VSRSTPRCAAEFLYYVVFGVKFGGSVSEVSFEEECAIQFYAEIFGKEVTV